MVTECKILKLRVFLNHLINHAKINKHIVISSAINILEIWDKSLYEKSINEATLDFGELAEEVMGDKYDDKIS